METPGALRSGVCRTVASMMNRVQAKEWMPPLSREDCKVHRKAHEQLHAEQEDESIVPERHLQYGENDPLPLKSWVPSVFTEEQGLTTYRHHIIYTKDYLGPIRQWFYQFYGQDLNAEQVASLCLLWQIAGNCEEAFFLAKWIQPFSDISSLNLHHLLSIILPPQMLPE